MKIGFNIELTFCLSKWMVGDNQIVRVEVNQVTATHWGYYQIGILVCLFFPFSCQFLSLLPYTSHGGAAFPYDV